MISESQSRNLQYSRRSGRIPLLIELTQLEEEGKDATGLRQRVEEIWNIEDLLEREMRCEEFLQHTYSLPVSPDFLYHEPDELDNILAEWGDVTAVEVEAIGEEEYLERVHGGFLGRCCGCMLGIPVESFTRERLDDYLKESGQFPLTTYFRLPTPEEAPAGFKMKYRRFVDCMMTDDDIEYVMVNLFTLERHGRECTSTDIGYSWLEALPMHRTSTAEILAYRNMSMLREPPLSGRYCNPYREWIGAQIRSDVWGYINPGDPFEAATYAYMDATVSHVKNGVYCAMFNSVLMALAFTSGSLEEAVRNALLFVPHRSRCAEAVGDCLSWYGMYGEYANALDAMYQKYGHYDATHSINNLCVCVLALLYSEHDFTKGIVKAVAAGIDTDCNGATVGSVLGIFLGAKSIPEKWTGPLNGAYQTSVAGQGRVSIEAVARRLARFRS